MALRYGNCTNFGLCTKADTRAKQTVPEGSDFVCEECKRPLTATGGSASGGGGDARRSFPIWLIALALFLVGGSCWVLTHRKSSPQESVASPGAAPGGGSAAVLLRLSGSNTIGSQLAPDLVESRLAAKGASGIHRVGGSDETTVTATLNGSPISVQVNAHGSATAFTDLGSNSCDIGMASRKIKPREAADLRTKGLGDLTSNTNERVVGL